MTVIELATELDEIYKTLKVGLDRTPEGLLAELDCRCRWLARSAELEADAQFLLDQKRGEVADKHIEVSATLLREIIARDCAQENRIYTLAERLNSTLIHSIDAIRSILSYEKEGMKINR